MLGGVIVVENMVSKGSTFTNMLDKAPHSPSTDLPDVPDDNIAKTPGSMAMPANANTIDARRYRKVRWFFLKATLHVFWWDVILNRPVLRHVRIPPLPRWQRLARVYRGLAVDMGGVLIKLGQFLSTRVDILPAEVTDELAELQDHVPSAPSEEIIDQIEADFKRPISDIFAWFSSRHSGAASLAQVHKARLFSGEAVAVKVLRPGIEVLIETDLIAITQVVRWLKYYKPICRFVDLDRLIDEFVTVTRKELDFQAEGSNAENFARDFADDSQVYIPKIFWNYTAPHTLTMEDVAFIRIDDVADIEAAGVNGSEVAKKLFNLYMEQFFVTHFVHADPHAGNLFVKPLHHPDEARPEGSNQADFRPHDPIPYYPNRPFQIVFVDFGMAVTIPERLRSSLRKYVIGVGTRDARRIVQSYVEGGFVLPGTDLKLLEQITQSIIDQFWETLLVQVKNVDLYAYNKFFLQKYRELGSDGGLQIQTDLLFVLRAMGILSGMVAKLDPDFDAWAETAPFAQRLLQEEWQNKWQERLPEVIDFALLLFRMPKRLDDILRQVEQGTLTIQTALTVEAKSSLQQTRRTVNRQSWIMIAVGLFIAGVIWHVGHLVLIALDRHELQGHDFGMWLIVLGVMSFLWGMLRIK